MAESPIPAAPPKGAKGKGKGAKSGLLGSLNPKQKRMAAIVGVAMLLALIVLLNRRSSPAALPLEESGGGYADDAEEIARYDTVPVGSTFADNGPGFGQLSTALTDSLGEVGGTLDEVGTSLDFQTDAFIEEQEALGVLGEEVGDLTKALPSIGAGLAGEIGNLRVQNQNAKKAAAKKAKAQRKKLQAKNERIKALKKKRGGGKRKGGGKGKRNDKRKGKGKGGGGRKSAPKRRQIKRNQKTNRRRSRRR